MSDRELDRADGVFLHDEADRDARPRFLELDPPSDADVRALLDEIIERVLATLRKHGRLDDETDDGADTDPQLLLALGPAPRAKSPAAVDELLPRLCARRQGFSLHAGTAVHRNDRIGLERLCRYGLRPALAQGRLSRATDGTVRYEMKRRFADGRHVLLFHPQQFLLRLCALVPPPRFQMVRHAGLFAAHARGRRAITGRGMCDSDAQTESPAPPTSSAPRRGSANVEDLPGPDDPARRRRLEWATLMKRTHGIDALECPVCGGRMQLIATIEDQAVASKILEHIGLPARARRARPPIRANSRRRRWNVTATRAMMRAT